jgi:hypothetical protein
MAGLLDIFGTGGSDTMSLLGMSPEAIQRNRDDAQAQALYALAGRLFQGGNTGQSIIEGLQAGQKAYKGGMQDTLQSQLQNYQLQELKKKKELEQQALMRQQAVENEITKAYRPQTFAETPLTNIMGQEIAGPNQPQAAGLGLESLAPKLMATKEGRTALNELLTAQKSMAGETFKLGEGEKQYQRDPLTGQVKEVATGAPKEKELKYQDIGNAIVAFDSKGKEVSRIAKGRAPEGPVNFQTIETDQGLMAFNPRTLQMTPVLDAKGQPITKTGKPTEAETNAAGFASRMVAANQITSKLATGQQPKFGEAVLSAIPLIGKTIPEVIPEGIGGLSAERRQYLQAANNFIRANLRKESGAAIGADEWLAEFVNYFPQYNDDEQTIKNKAIFRNILTQNMVGAGGKSYKAPNMNPEESMTDVYGLNPRLRDSLRGGR